jgi:hypothetical protein
MEVVTFDDEKSVIKQIQESVISNDFINDYVIKAGINSGNRLFVLLTKY